MSLAADSELSCALAVLPANGAEGANAKPRSASEEQAQGNDSARLAVARSGSRGAGRAGVREERDGPPLPVSVPPSDWTLPAPEVFPPAEFTLPEAGDEGRCPGGRRPARGGEPSGGTAGHATSAPPRAALVQGGRRASSPQPMVAAPGARPPTTPSPARRRSVRRRPRSAPGDAHSRAASGSWRQ